MPREKKQSEPEEQAGAPEWMVTFSDCMTLLLTFFVLLLSFSSFDDKDDYLKMSSSLAEQFSFGAEDLTEKDAVFFLEQQLPDHELQWGSEKPTTEEGQKNRSKKTTRPLEFLKFKTFLMESDQAFLGRSAALSAEGRLALSDLSQYLKKFPDSAVIISENTSQSSQGVDGNYFQRVWSVLDYLTCEKGIDQKKINISVEGTALKDYHSINAGVGLGRKEGVVEITLLDRSL